MFRIFKQYYIQKSFFYQFFLYRITNFRFSNENPQSFIIKLFKKHRFFLTEKMSNKSLCVSVTWSVELNNDIIVIYRERFLFIINKFSTTEFDTLV